MSKTENHKLKLLYIKKYLEEMTDENHSVTTGDIIAMLESYGISAERKSVYSDIETLKAAGCDIINIKGRNGGIKMLSRAFELTELKILVDAVQSSRFITLKKSSSLINKLESFASIYERNDLRRNVFIANRIKSENESIYYNTDKIFNAINANSQISFRYFNLTHDKQKSFHNNGSLITVSPYGLQFDNGNYYLIAYDTAADLVKHYRVDRMDGVAIENIPRTGKAFFKNFDVAEYSKKTVKMFTGKVEKVILKCSDDMTCHIIDKFGKGCKFFSTPDGEYTVCVKVALSPTFYSWVFTYGGKIKINGPQSVIDDYKKQLNAALHTIDNM